MVEVVADEEEVITHEIGWRLAAELMAEEFEQTRCWMSLCCLVEDAGEDNGGRWRGSTSSTRKTEQPLNQNQISSQRGWRRPKRLTVMETPRDKSGAPEQSSNEAPDEAVEAKARANLCVQ
jgi:hypothetical protein